MDHAGSSQRKYLWITATITLEIPDTKSKVVMDSKISNMEPYESARNLGSLLVHIEEIENKVRAITKNDASVRWFGIEPEEDGSVTIYWWKNGKKFTSRVEWRS